MSTVIEPETKDWPYINMAKLSVREQAIVFRELATLVGAGIALVSSLDELLQRRLSPDMRTVLRHAQHQVSHGNRLSTAFRANARLFSPLTIALIEAGEEGGRLEEMLQDAAMYLERELELRSLIDRETLYPKILAFACLLIPLATQTVIAVVQGGPGAGVMKLLSGIGYYLLLFGLPILIICLGSYWLRQSNAGSLWLDTFKLKILLFGTIIRRLALLKFCRALAALFNAGVDFPRAVKLAAESCGNLRLAQIISEAVPKIEQGQKLGDILTLSPLRGELFLRLLKTGEQTGNVDAMLYKAADHYEDETQSLIKRCTVAIVPIGVIIAGFVVVLQMVQFYSGYFTGIMNYTP